ncbi:MAG: hypothetical protein N2053_02930, partial [Chitinispirillaceae bacterium]|nr:hypothetical protein [Chitinispirillaceae bacterium]
DTSEVHQETQKSINDARTKIEEVEKRIIDFVGSVRRISGFVHTLLFLCLISSIITILGIQRNLKLTEKETAEIRKQLGEFNELKIEMTNILEEKNELQYKIERLEKLLRLANEAKENNEKKIDLLKEELHMLREKAERLETENNRYYATNVELEKQIRLLQTKLEDNEKPS